MKKVLPPDITVKDYYNSFIYNAKIELYKVDNNIIKQTADIDELHKYLTACREEIKSNLGITLDRYIEFNNKEYNTAQTLYNKAKYLYDKNDANKDRKLVISLYKYCEALNKLNKLNEELDYVKSKVNISFNEYQEYLYRYYTTVHEILLKGEAYRFNYMIGTMHINRYRIYTRPIRININETNKRRKELIAQGKKIWNKDEALIAKQTGQEYDAVDYRITEIRNHTYKILVTDSILDSKKSITFTCANYINNKYKGLTYQEIVDKFCNTLEDIYKLQVSIDVKVKLLMIKYPGFYVNFIRNERGE